VRQESDLLRTKRNTWNLTTGLELPRDATDWDQIYKVMLISETGGIKQGGQCRSNVKCDIAVLR